MATAGQSFFYLATPPKYLSRTNFAPKRNNHILPNEHSVDMKKEAVLHSTLELISELGVHNTPMSKIAKHADVAVGTIYHHFDSKDEILNELYLEIKKEFGERCQAALDKSQTPKEAFSEIFKAVYHFYTENPLKFIFCEQVAFTPIITKETEEKSQAYYQSVIEFLKEEIEKGTFRKLPIDLFGQMLYGNIKTLIQMKLTEDEKVTDEMLEEAIHTSWISFSAS